ncbi:DUF2867 domain-containing protein [Reichenbachiella sp.]|uniref:DUF2867 domain-containing protein n=1 Tax=Reichenbachiella sp. TaxID=2184521 RepID=UPI003B594B49
MKNQLDNMKPTINSHLAQPWLAHEIVSGFRIEDIWHLPIDIKPNTPIKNILDTFVEAINQIGTKGFAGWLFKFRNWLGRLFHWEDQSIETQDLAPGVLKKRYATQTQTTVDELPKGGFGHFDLVYALDQEVMLEIENKTVQAAIHLAKVVDDQEANAQMTIYVKPNGIFGQIYMLLIKPFRHWIVYPALLRMLANQWNSKYA